MKKTLTNKQREKALIELISDAVQLKFNKELIKRYKLQLKYIQSEISRQKQKIKDYKEGLK